MAIFSYRESLTSTNLHTSLLVISQTSLSSELIMYVNLSASHIFTKEGLILDNSWTKDSFTVTYLLFGYTLTGNGTHLLICCSVGKLDFQLGFSVVCVNQSRSLDYDY